MTRLKMLILMANLIVARQASAIQLVYIEENGGNGNPRGLYNFDTTTGLSTFRAPLSDEARFYGLAVRPSDGTVFTVSPDANPVSGYINRLWTIDINTGAATFVGDLGGGDAVCNIGFHPTTNVLYGLERNDRALFTIDQTTAARTPIGLTNAVTGHGADFSPGGVLLATTYQGELYTLNTTTAQETLVGGTPAPNGVLFEDAAFSPAGLMYVSDFFGKVWRFDTTTGARVVVGDTNMGLGLVGVIAIVPEPTAAALSLLGLGVTIGLFRRRN
jgi:hypothetical protein